MKNYAYILLLAIAFSSCGSGVTVTSDYDKSVDFSKYKTYSYYGWADNSDKILTGFDKERFETAFANEFAMRGWENAGENGDAIISLYVVVDKKTSYTSYTNHFNNGVYGGIYDPYYGYGYGYGPTMGTSTTTTQQNDYLEGTLIVDVFDAATKKHIWQGIGKKTVSENKEKRAERIKVAVAEIMKAFPIPAPQQ